MQGRHQQNVDLQTLHPRTKVLQLCLFKYLFCLSTAVDALRIIFAVKFIIESVQPREYASTLVDNPTSQSFDTVFDVLLVLKQFVLLIQDLSKHANLAPE